ncbi:MerR family transcriptional regulator [Paenibacillus sp.]|uniref:MerR family transcriptional regulator n=1 Tax=Paenibacillus sp. TaxID=58172 RepID=UPI002D447720|nr:effector binding domain-containing protein [Paenibacillus sp.]HZG85003.1 effector binding domain-containing protein [Paenibacillus sp.]
MTKLTIGQMARLCGVTPKTLRHYEDIGLFVPAEVHPENQYRYYTPDQLHRLRSILFLRDFGIGLETIRELSAGGTLSDHSRLAPVLREQANRVRSTIDAQTELLRRIDAELERWEASASDISGGRAMEANIVKLDGFKTAGIAVRDVCASPTFGQVWARFLPQEGAIPHRANPNVSFGLCYDFDGERITYAACVGVSSTDGLPDGFDVIDVPAQTYAVFPHRGPVSRISETFARIHDTWLPAQGLQPTEGIDFEWYDERFYGPDDECSVIDLYIPIVEPAPA